MPIWVEYILAFLLVMGGIFALIGSYGLAKLNDFYMRLHGPTKATTLGLGCILTVSAVYFTMTASVVSLHEALIVVFLFITAPVSAHLLSKTALAEGFHFSSDQENPLNHPLNVGTRQTHDATGIDDLTDPQEAYEREMRTEEAAMMAQAHEEDDAFDEAFEADQAVSGGIPVEDGEVEEGWEEDSGEADAAEPDADEAGAPEADETADEGETDSDAEADADANGDESSEEVEASDDADSAEDAADVESDVETSDSDDAESSDEAAEADADADDDAESSDEAAEADAEADDVAEAPDEAAEADADSDEGSDESADADGEEDEESEKA